ncbi:DUF2184 domain-containing protein [Sphingoaurantiacus capsulatus]|uniref:DUF2184 domain-containing protein n=1 Tax=Sphingoaurantiacus capsulatus TaxID=1771310 RepID=A0ABV7X6B5_9SPHN
MSEINFHDAQQALGFLQPQLQRIETEVYQTRFPSFDYSRLMFVNTDGGMWDAGSVFYSGSIAGAAQFLSGKGVDMPFAEVAQSQHLRTNHFAGIGYEWSLQELQRAAALGRNLGSEKALAASKVAEAFLYGIAMRGSDEKGITGLINDAQVPAALVAADGTGSARDWASKDADKVARDVNAVLNAPATETKETHRANTLLLPTSRLQAIAGKRIGDGTDSVLKFIKENNAYTLETGQPLTIIGSRELETAGADSAARMIAYDNSREVMQFHLPGPHEFLPAFQKSPMLWEVAGIMNVGGVEIRLPKAVAYRDGL